jgi:hypothetical protein
MSSSSSAPKLTLARSRSGWEPKPRFQPLHNVDKWQPEKRKDHRGDPR